MGQARFCGACGARLRFGACEMFGLLKSFMPGGIWVYAAIALVAASTSAWATYTITRNAYEASQLRAVEVALEQERETQRRALEASIRQAREEGRLESQGRTIIREVIKHVPDLRACDLGPDALRLLNAARRGELPAAAPGVSDANPGIGAPAARSDIAAGFR